MNKSPTRESKYPSRYSPKKFVSGVQYITELICEKRAKYLEKDLPIKFWQLDEWRKYFQYQIMLANKLVKKYGEHCVIAALNDKRMWKTYSLRGSFLLGVIEEYSRKEDVSRRIAKELEYDFSEKKTFDSSNDKKSIISRLKDLE